MKWHNENVTIKKTNRKKTMDIVVERNGTLCVLVPKKLNEERILDILNKKEYDITKKVIQWKESHQNRIVRRFIDGQSFMYLGKNYCLHFVDTPNVPLSLQNGRFVMDSRINNPRQVFVDFYKKQARMVIQKRFCYFANMLDVKPIDMQIRDIRSRWGSCTPNKRIFYHWKTVMLPPKILDYIVLHELMHIKYPRHSRQFWNEMANVLPDYMNAIDWLKIQGIHVEL